MRILQIEKEECLQKAGQLLRLAFFWLSGGKIKIRSFGQDAQQEPLKTAQNGVRPERIRSSCSCAVCAWCTKISNSEQLRKVSAALLIQANREP